MDDSKYGWINSKRATKWKHVGDNITQLIYHDTPVVAVIDVGGAINRDITKHIITLRHDGYQTVTTKARINSAFKYTFTDFDIHVFQKKGTWYVRYRDEESMSENIFTWEDDSITFVIQEFYSEEQEGFYNVINEIHANDNDKVIESLSLGFSI